MRKRARKDDGYLERILTAKVYDVAVESALETVPAISRRSGNHVLLKREDKQQVFSFKLRGAYNKMANLAPAMLERGVICASAGNHAQGVALAAQKLGVAATVVMPVTTPRIKVTAVSARGAQVELHGDSYHEAYLHARTLARKRRAAFVHPYDDPLVIAGQGTVGLEILRQHPHPIDAIYVPVGGGGLIGGIAAYVKRVSPRTRVIGVEPVDSSAMFQSLKAGRRVTLPHVNLFADGVAVRQVGKETLALARRYVDSMVLVDTDEICAAIKDIFEDTRTVVEPAGALALAGAKRDLARRKWKGRTVVAVVSGANMNFDRLRFVAERAELGEHREAVLAVTIPERPGSYRELCALLGKRSVTEFNYRYAPGREAAIFLGVSVGSREETQRLVATLHRHGIPAADLSDNEMAKQHGRHLVGGRVALKQPEMLYRFEFPERPGALMNFLDRMGAGWNISLFHYRNQGADVGRVLVGLQVPDREKGSFRKFLRELGYDFTDESRNPAYRFFLK
ncbi:MAG TPA: threonine ammonia-lyase, biosynthetic [Usitatibacter sp.]|nr:threonine ammonia-lyase, biosynthetic [Usitatibacter sp.]